MTRPDIHLRSLPTRPRANHRIGIGVGLVAAASFSALGWWAYDTARASAQEHQQAIEREVEHNKIRLGNLFLEEPGIQTPRQTLEAVDSGCRENDEKCSVSLVASYATQNTCTLAENFQSAYEELGMEPASPDIRRACLDPSFMVYFTMSPDKKDFVDGTEFSWSASLDCRLKALNDVGTWGPQEGVCSTTVVWQKVLPTPQIDG